MTVPRAHRAIIRAMLNFANLEGSWSEGQAQAIFQKLPFKWAVHHGWFTAEPGMSRGVVDRSGRIHSWALQREVQRWLRRIASGDRRAVWWVASTINDVLFHTVRLAPQIDARTLRVYTTISIGLGLNALDVCTLGTLYLFEWDLLRKVQRCPLPECGRFRVTFKGKPVQYCSPKHLKEAERRRVKKWRIKTGGNPNLQTPAHARSVKQGISASGNQ